MKEKRNAKCERERERSADPNEVSTKLCARYSFVDPIVVEKRNMRQLRRLDNEEMTITTMYAGKGTHDARRGDEDGIELR